MFFLLSNDNIIVMSSIRSMFGVTGIRAALHNMSQKKSSSANHYEAILV